MPSIKKQSAAPSLPKKKPLAAPRSSKASIWDAVESVRMLLWGESGTGKTTFWGSWPGKTLCLICSGGKKPGELRSINTPEHRERIIPHVVNSSEEFRHALDMAEEFENVVLDHASGFADVLLKEIIGIDELPEQRGWGNATQQQYGTLALQCKESFKALLNLPGNVIIVAQQRTFGGTEDGSGSEVIKPTVGAALTPSVVGWLNPACDYVVQTYKRPKMKTVTTKLAGKDHTTQQRDKGIEYCLRTGPHDVFQTKFRLPKGQTVPECIVDPDYEKFMSIIRGKP